MGKGHIVYSTKAKKTAIPIELWIGCKSGNNRYQLGTNYVSLLRENYDAIVGSTLCANFVEPPLKTQENDGPMIGRNHTLSQVFRRFLYFIIIFPQTPQTH